MSSNASHLGGSLRVYGSGILGAVLGAIAGITSCAAWDFPAEATGWPTGVATLSGLVVGYALGFLWLMRYDPL